MNSDKEEKVFIEIAQKKRSFSYELRFFFHSDFQKDIQRDRMTA